MNHVLRSNGGKCPEPAEADSDSGDSLFVTQKTVPEPARSGRRHRGSLRSSPRIAEESKAHTSPSDPRHESTPQRKKKRKAYKLPKYNFPFLLDTSRKSCISTTQNTALHIAAMEGFFKCLIGFKRESVEHLPTVDVDGQISPLSEQEEGMAEDEDMKVVERKCFLVKLKGKQSSHSESKLQKKKDGSARQQTPRGRRRKISEKIPQIESTPRVTALDAENPDNEEASSGDLIRRGSVDRDLPAQKEAPKTKTQGNDRSLSQQETGDSCYDSDATFCEPSDLQESSRDHTQNKEASTTKTTAQVYVLHTDDLSETGEADEEPQSQSLLLDVPAFITNKKRNEKKIDHENMEEEEMDQSQQKRPEGEHEARNHPQYPSHEATIAREEERDVSEPKQKKKKRENDTSAAENAIQEANRELKSHESPDDSVMSPREKKKTKRRGKDNGDNVEQLQSSDLDAEIPKKKKKKKKEEISKVSEGCNEEDPTNRILDWLSTSTQHAEGSGNVDVGLSDDTVTEMSLKRKKKRRKGTGDSEQLPSSTAAEPPSDEANIQQQKGKEHMMYLLDLMPIPLKQKEESENALKHTLVSEETLESSLVKRKKHKKKQQSSSNDGEEGRDVTPNPNINLTPDPNDDVTLEESTGMSLSNKKKKRRRNEDEGEFEQLTSDAAAEPQRDEAEKQGKKKKRKKGGMLVVGEQTPAEILGSGFTVAPEETSESSPVKIEKHKNQQSSNDGEEGVDVEESEGMSPRRKKKKKKKKKKRAVPDGLDVSSPRVENEKFEDRNSPMKTTVCPEEQNGELVTGKKKKKKKVCERSSDDVTQNDDSVSAPQKEKKRTSSFLAADAGGSEETDERVRKKKKKKKKKKKTQESSVGQDGVEADHRGDLKEANQTNDAGAKRKKKQRKSK